VKREVRGWLAHTPLTRRAWILCLSSAQAARTMVRGEIVGTVIKKSLENRVVAVLIFLAICTLTPRARAKEKPVEQQPASVIAHVPVLASPVSQMFLRREKGKRYLYVQQTATEAYTVVDVTKPDHPTVLDRVPPLAKPSTEKVQMVGDGLALAETPESSGSGTARHELAPAKSPLPTGQAHPTESVRVLDLSDPKNPRTLQTFEGVTSILAEDGRGLIYIANGQGLWILQHKPKHELPPCDTTASFSAIANCQ
jgi:hypothetical protein